MASITRTKKGATRILFYDKDGYRKAIYLGRCSKDDAEKIKHRVESVLSAGILGRSIDQDDASWLAKFPKVREKFELVGLIAPSKPVEAKESATLGDFLDGYMERYGATRKPATRIVWLQVIGNLKALMPKGIRLNEITAGHCKEFVEKMRAKGMADSTLCKRVAICRQFLGDAVDWEFIPKNPFKAVKVEGGGATTNEYVTHETINKILAVAPLKWKVIIGLARYGGLRTPSETLSLKWADVDLVGDLMHVPEPKVERHKGRGVRKCPISPELREILVNARKDAPLDEEYVVDAGAYRAAANSGSGWQSANLRTELVRLLKKHDIPLWNRLFHSLRASRQTDLVNEGISLHVVCALLGNSPQIANRHYLKIKDDDFTRVSKIETNTTRAEPILVQKERGLEVMPNDAGPIEDVENTGENSVSSVIPLAYSMEDNGLEPKSGLPRKTKGKRKRRLFHAAL